MSKEQKYSLEALKEDFPDDEACLKFIFDTLHSRACSCGGEYSPIPGRKQFQCSRCRYQIAPMVGTIFEKSPTHLTLWFHAIWVFSNAKSGISTKEMERHLGVTYKCAYRILSQIRKALPQSTDKLRGTVETDMALFGGSMKKGRKELRAVAFERKLYVLGAIQRGGKVRAELVEGSAGKKASDEFLLRNVEKWSTLVTDYAQIYHGLPFYHQSINHATAFAYRGVHINTIESFWGHLKRSMKGTFKSLSREKFQEYLDAFVFHWNNRGNDRDRFSVLLGSLLQFSR